MRRTRLLILPGARCLTQTCCILLYLSCPIIGALGREQPELARDDLYIEKIREIYGKNRILTEDKELCCITGSRINCGNVYTGNQNDSISIFDKLQYINNLGNYISGNSCLKGNTAISNLVTEEPSTTNDHFAGKIRRSMGEAVKHREIRRRGLENRVNRNTAKNREPGKAHERMQYRFSSSKDLQEPRDFRTRSFERLSSRSDSTKRIEPTRTIGNIRVSILQMPFTTRENDLNHRREINEFTRSNKEFDLIRGRSDTTSRSGLAARVSRSARISNNREVSHNILSRHRDINSRLEQMKITRSSADRVYSGRDLREIYTSSNRIIVNARETSMNRRDLKHRTERRESVSLSSGSRRNTIERAINTNRIMDSVRVSKRVMTASRRDINESRRVNTLRTNINKDLTRRNRISDYTDMNERDRTNRRIEMTKESTRELSKTLNRRTQEADISRTNRINDSTRARISDVFERRTSTERKIRVNKVADDAFETTRGILSNRRDLNRRSASEEVIRSNVNRVLTSPRSVDRSSERINVRNQRAVKSAEVVREVSTIIPSNSNRRSILNRRPDRINSLRSERNNLNNVQSFNRVSRSRDSINTIRNNRLNRVNANIRVLREMPAYRHLSRKSEGVEISQNNRDINRSGARLFNKLQVRKDLVELTRRSSRNTDNPFKLSREGMQSRRDLNHRSERFDITDSTRNIDATRAKPFDRISYERDSGARKARSNIFTGNTRVSTRETLPHRREGDDITRSQRHMELIRIRTLDSLTDRRNSAERSMMTKKFTGSHRETINEAIYNRRDLSGRKDQAPVQPIRTHNGRLQERSSTVEFNQRQRRSIELEKSQLNRISRNMREATREVDIKGVNVQRRFERIHRQLVNDNRRTGSRLNEIRSTMEFDNDGRRRHQPHRFERSVNRMPMYRDSRQDAYLTNIEKNQVLHRLSYFETADKRFQSNNILLKEVTNTSDFNQQSNLATDSKKYYLNLNDDRKMRSAWLSNDMFTSPSNWQCVVTVIQETISSIWKMKDETKTVFVGGAAFLLMTSSVK